MPEQRQEWGDCVLAGGTVLQLQIWGFKLDLMAALRCYLKRCLTVEIKHGTVNTSLFLESSLLKPLTFTQDEYKEWQTSLMFNVHLTPFFSCLSSHILPSLTTFPFAFFFSLGTKPQGGKMQPRHASSTECCTHPERQPPGFPDLTFICSRSRYRPPIHPLMCDPFFISVQTLFDPSIPTLNFNKLINTFTSAFKIISCFSSRA